jgi:hypothetical protein
MKKTLMFTMIAVSTLLSCKKNTEEVIPPTPVVTDPIAGEWYMHLVDADAISTPGNHYYAYRAAGANAANRSNISFTTVFGDKSLYKFTKEAEGKYSISMTGYPNQFLLYQTNNIAPYESRMFFSVNQITNDNLYTFERLTGATDTYLIKSVSNPATALSASITNGTILRPNFVAAGASFTYQKWKLEK